MKQFIRENLRLQLENLLCEVRADFEELFAKIRNKTTYLHSIEDLYDLSKQAKTLAEKDPDKIGSINDGTKYYKFKVTLLKNNKGCKIESIATSGKDEREYIPSQDGKAIMLQAKAYSDQVNPEDSDKTKYTPIVVTKIKLLLDDTMVKIIEKFIKGGDSYTADDQLEKNKKLAAEKTPEERGYLKGKYDTRQIANATKKANKANDIKKIEKYNLTPSQKIEIDKLEKDLAKNIRFLNTAKESADYSRKNNEVVPDGVVNRIESLNKEIKRIKSDIDKINPNYGK